jgi:hypothetical protein
MNILLLMISLFFSLSAYTYCPGTIEKMSHVSVNQIWPFNNSVLFEKQGSFLFEGSKYVFNHPSETIIKVKETSNETLAIVTRTPSGYSLYELKNQKLFLVQNIIFNFKFENLEITSPLVDIAFLGGQAYLLSNFSVMQMSSTDFLKGENPFPKRFIFSKPTQANPRRGVALIIFEDKVHVISKDKEKNSFHQELSLPFSVDDLKSPMLSNFYTSNTAGYEAGTVVTHPHYIIAKQTKTALISQLIGTLKNQELTFSNKGYITSSLIQNNNNLAAKGNFIAFSTGEILSYNSQNKECLFASSQVAKKLLWLGSIDQGRGYFLTPSRDVFTFK